MTPEESSAVLAVVVTALTQLGIPAVFVAAWWWERNEHRKTQAEYVKALKQICNRMSAREAPTPPSSPATDTGSEARSGR